MGELIDLFSRRQVNTEEVTPDFVEQFILDHLGDLNAAVADLNEAKTEEELEEFMRAVQKLVSGWPKPRH